MPTDHRIPPMTDALGKHWDQPSRDEIVDVTDSHATMSRAAFLNLRLYSCSIPTGVYAGKMWKCGFRGDGGGWLLRWYDRIESDDMLIESRIIRIRLTEMEFLAVVIEWGRDYRHTRRK